MRLFHGTDNAEIQRPTVLTLGVFDGLHLGHQLVMRTVSERARAVGAVPTVITFDPHPRAVLHPQSAPPLLQTLDQKVEGFGVLGIEQTIVINFTKDFSRIRAEDFLRDVVKERLHPGKFTLAAASHSVMTAKGTSIFYGKSAGNSASLLTKFSKSSYGINASARAEFESC